MVPSDFNSDNTYPFKAVSDSFYTITDSISSSFTKYKEYITTAFFDKESNIQHNLNTSEQFYNFAETIAKSHGLESKDIVNLNNKESFLSLLNNSETANHKNTFKLNQFLQDLTNKIESQSSISDKQNLRSEFNTILIDKISSEIEENLSSANISVEQVDFLKINSSSFSSSNLLELYFSIKSILKDTKFKTLSNDLKTDILNTNIKDFTSSNLIKYEIAVNYSPVSQTENYQKFEGWWKIILPAKYKIEKTLKKEPTDKLLLNTNKNKEYIEIIRYPQASFPERIQIGKVEKMKIKIKSEQTGKDKTSLRLKIPSSLQGVWIQIVICENENIQVIGEKNKQVFISTKEDSQEIVFYIEAIKVGKSDIRLQFFQEGYYLNELVVSTVISSDENIDRNSSIQSVHNQDQQHNGNRWNSNNVVAPDMTILIARTNQQNVYQVFCISDKGHRHINCETIHCDAKSQADFNFLFKEILGDGLYPQQIENRISNEAKKLFQQFFPQKLQDEFWRMREKGLKTIQIISEEPYIPWEIIKPVKEKDDKVIDECNYLCIDFVISRWKTGTSDLKIPEGLVQNVTIVIPDVGLKDALEEFDWIKKFLKKYEIIPDSISTVNLLMNKFKKSDFDLMHFATHGIYDPNIVVDDTSIDLGNGGKISPGDISEAFKNKNPIIIINTCNSGRQVFRFNSLSGWGEKLIKNGACIFIGTLWPVADETARKFIVKLYENLEMGLSIGEAVKEARNICKTPGDLSALAYVLYSYPHHTIQFNKPLPSP